MPAKHSAAAAKLYIVGRRRMTAHARNGTSTQYVPVRNELFAAVVPVSPPVLSKYAKMTSNPSANPARKWSGSLPLARSSQDAEGTARRR